MPIVKKVTLIAIIDNEFNLLLTMLMYGLGGIMADRIECFFSSRRLHVGVYTGVVTFITKVILIYTYVQEI